MLPHQLRDTVQTLVLSELELVALLRPFYRAIDMVLASRARSLHSQSKLSRWDVGERWSLVGEETESGTCDAVRVASFQMSQ